MNGFTQTQALDEIRELCQSYGKFVQLIRPAGKTFIFLIYETDSQAAEAKTKFETAGVQCNYGHLRENGRTPTSAPDQSNQQKQIMPTKANDAVKVALQAGENIIITHVTGYHVHAVQAKKHAEYIGFMKMMATIGKEADNLKLPIERHSWALALHQGQYTRVIVTSSVRATDAFAPVYFVDIGVDKDVAIEQLKLLDTSYSERRWLHRLRLNDVSERETITDAAARYLDSFIGKEIQLRSVHNGGSCALKVELYDPFSSFHINKIFNWLNCEFKVNHLTLKLPILGQARLLCMVDDSLLKNGNNMVAFIEDTDRSAFQMQISHIQEHGKSVVLFSEYAAKADDLCIARINEKWFRCVFIETAAGKAKVYLVDYCRTEYVHPQNIRKISQKSAEMPILTFAGQFHGYDEAVVPPKIFDLMDFVKNSPKILTKAIYKMDKSDFIYTVHV